MGIRLATWNVNSLRQRLDHLAHVGAEAGPDLICLQETKVTDDLFPRAGGLRWSQKIGQGVKVYSTG